MSVASTLPGHARRIFGGLQSGGASRADVNLEGGAVKAWLEETCLVVECARSLDGERHSQTPGHDLPFWPLRLLLCEIGWLQVHVKPSLSSSKILPPSSTDTAGRKVMLISA